MTEKAIAIEESKPVSQLVLSRVPFILYGIGGIVLAQSTLFGYVRPFAIALLAVAMLRHWQYGLSVSTGLFLGMSNVAFGGEYLATILVATATVAILWKKQWWLNKHWILALGVIAATNGFLKQLFYFLPMDYQYTGFGILVESVLIAGVIWCIDTALNAWDKLISRGSMDTGEMVSWLVVTLSILLGLESWRIAGLDVQTICSRVLVLVVAYAGGASNGAMIGVLVGVLPCLTGAATTASMGLYGIAGLVGGLLKPWGKWAVWGGFVLGNLVLAFNFIPSNQLVTTFLECVIAGVAFMLLPLHHPQLLREASPCFKDMVVINGSDHKLQQIGQVFVDLSEELQEDETVAQQNPQQLLEAMEGIYQRVFSQVCVGCTKKQLCWERDHSQTYRELSSACDKLEKQGLGNGHCFSVGFLSKCKKPAELEIALSHQIDLFKQKQHYQYQVKVARETVAKQLAGIGQVVGNMATAEDYNELAEKTITAHCAKESIPLQYVHLYENTLKDWSIMIQLKNCQGGQFCEQTLPTKISKWLKRSYKLEDTTCGYSEHHNCQLTLVPVKSYCLEVGSAVAAKNGNSVSGDNWTQVAIGPGKHALIISDGMGTGTEANRQSATTVKLLQQLLVSGVTQQTALEIVNAVLLLRSEEESFATVDLAMIDAISGKVDFVKISAAPSFVKRQKQIKVYEGCSLPVGIMHEVDIAQMEHRLQVNDLLIMMSDGVYEAYQYEQQWQEILKELPTHEPQLAAEYILAMVNSLNGQVLKDDMTVVVAKLQTIDQ